MWEAKVTFILYLYCGYLDVSNSFGEANSVRAIFDKVKDTYL